MVGQKHQKTSWSVSLTRKDLPSSQSHCRQALGTRSWGIHVSCGFPLPTFVSVHLPALLYTIYTYFLSFLVRFKPRSPWFHRAQYFSGLFWKLFCWSSSLYFSLGFSKSRLLLNTRTMGKISDWRLFCISWLHRF